MDNQDHVIKLQQERERRQNLEGKKNALAKRVYELVNRTLENDQRDLPDPAQLQNLRSLAAGTDSLEELKIYILYQISRPGAPISQQFGRPLVDIIEELAQEERAVEQVRLLLGYLYRYARYARRDNQPTSGGAPRQSSNRSGGNR